MQPHRSRVIPAASLTNSPTKSPTDSSNTSPTATPTLLRSVPLQALPVASDPAVSGTPVPPPGSPSFSSPALVQHLLQAIAATPVSALKEALPALRILALALAAALALRITGATLHAIDEFPLVGGLLELVGLVRLLQFLSRNALRQQRRAELLARIEALRQQLLG